MIARRIGASAGARRDSLHDESQDEVVARIHHGARHCFDIRRQPAGLRQETIDHALHVGSRLRATCGRSGRIFDAGFAEAHREKRRRDLLQLMHPFLDELHHLLFMMFTMDRCRDDRGGIIFQSKPFGKMGRIDKIGPDSACRNIVGDTLRNPLRVTFACRVKHQDWLHSVHLRRKKNPPSSAPAAKAPISQRKSWYAMKRVLSPEISSAPAGKARTPPPPPPPSAVPSALPGPWPPPAPKP